MGGQRGEQRTLALAEVVGGHGGLDEAGRDGDAADVALAVLQRAGLGQADHTVFGRGVVRQRGHAHQAVDGGGVDDHAATTGEHGRNRRMGAVEDTVEIDVDDPAPLRRGQLGGPRTRTGDAGIAEQHVNASEGVHGAVDHGLAGRLIGHVGKHHQGFAADQLQGFLKASFIDIRQHHLGAEARKLDRRSTANAAGRAGHDDNLSSEIHVDSPHTGHMGVLVGPDVSPLPCPRACPCRQNAYPEMSGLRPPQRVELSLDA
ncbi:hypothetical protein D9M68_591720 [compost metagenome]